MPKIGANKNWVKSESRMNIAKSNKKRNILKEKIF